MSIDYILLDICGTLVPFQTADAFIEFVFKNNWKKYLVKILYFLGEIRILSIFGYRRKIVALKLLSGITKEKLNNISRVFFEEKILPNLDHNIIKFIKKNKSRVIIISGGFDIYLKYLKEYLCAEELICTELKFENNIYTGKINEIDCIGINKIKLLEKKNLSKKIIFEKTAVISDSFSDLPIFALGKYKYIKNPDKKLKKLIGEYWHDIEKI